MTGKAPTGASFADLIGPDTRRAALEQRLADARRQAYWQRLDRAPPWSVPAPEMERPSIGELQTDGWARRARVCDGSVIGAALARVEQVLSHGWPAVFAFVYDELWEALTSPGLVAVIEQALGGEAALWPGVWIHRVEATPGALGWPPHADEPDQPAFTDDDRVARASGWLALTPATIDNGCIHVIDADTEVRALRGGRSLDWSSATAALQSTRPLEAAPGDLLLWRTDIVHWGGRRWIDDAPARVALTFEAAPADVTPTGELWAAPFVMPPFDERLRRIGYALGAYAARAEREPLAHRFVPLADELRR